MTTAVTWPETLRPRDIGIFKRSRSISGSASLTGISQNIASDAGIWVVKAEDFPVVTRVRVLLWRTLEGLIGGRITPILFPIWDLDRRPTVIDTDHTPFSDGSYFSDGSGFAPSGFPAAVSADAALGATTIQIDYGAGGPIESGQFFSVGVRLYSINRVISDNGTRSLVNIWPPLREAIVLGDTAEFTNPQCKMRLATDQEMDLSLELGRFGFPSINLVEDTSP